MCIGSRTTTLLDRFITQAIPDIALSLHSWALGAKLHTTIVATLQYAKTVASLLRQRLSQCRGGMNTRLDPLGSRRVRGDVAQSFKVKLFNAATIGL